MALFGSKKKEEKKAEVTPGAKQEFVSNAPMGIAHVLKNPRITEKASVHQSVGVYTFDVETSATKTQIAEAVRAIYKVTPRKVRIVQVPLKRTRSIRTGRAGVKIGGKKAYVYLKSGETITIA